MKVKFKITVIIVNLVAVTLSVCLFFAGVVKAGSQRSQFAAQRWRSGNSDIEYSQLSVFFRDGVFDINSIGMMRVAIANAMTDASLSPEENTRLWIDSCNAEMGKFSASGTKKGRPECLVTATDGDFFVMRGFQLAAGSYYSADSLMQDGVVIDSQLAWQLFGSDNVVGMTMTLGGKEFYVSGVIETPSTKYEKKCAGEEMRAYISYKGAAYLQDGTEFTKVDSYEAVIPNPVKKFAYNILKSKTEDFGNDASLVENTERFSFTKSLAGVKSLGGMVVRSDSMALPWWENAARMTEFSLTFVYLFAAILLLIPAVTVISTVVVTVKFAKRNKHKAKEFAAAGFKAVKKKLPKKVKAGKQ